MYGHHSLSYVRRNAAVSNMRRSFRAVHDYFISCAIKIQPQYQRVSDVIDTHPVIGWIPSKVSKYLIKLLFLVTFEPRTVSEHRRRI